MKKKYASPEFDYVSILFEKLLENGIKHSDDEVPTVDGDDDLLG